MQSIRRTNRILTIALLAASVLTTVAPAAQAGHAYGRRYKRVYAAPAPYYYARPVVVHEHSAAPVLAGLVGGFILGAAVSSHATPVVVSANTYYTPAPHCAQYYYDSYCGEWFTSLSAAREHCGYARHPWQVQVYASRGGECMRTLRWSDGAWYDCGRGNDWDD